MLIMLNLAPNLNIEIARIKISENEFCRVTKTFVYEKIASQF